ncbi:zinc finger BED domain-containing protein isoform X2 [Megalops cyprinoides]|uniref:zinc finger BED domain-containing protein isoform X2 n=1 Tax=Megalops cyprinoides TaxID=118141 RepID=UPI001864ECEC|nr:zinc finger BED domain-containing protein isoform X2 [Megalops cyprinoides]
MASRKRSVVWSFFHDDLASKRAVCLVCSENILHCGNTTNMLKHLRSKHQEELADAVKSRRSGDGTRVAGRNHAIDISENAAEIQVSVTGEPVEHEHLMAGRAVSDIISEAYSFAVTKNKKRSAVWRYYQDGIDPNKVLCLVCSESINYPQNTSNLLRHLRKKHPSEYADIEDKVRERSDDGGRRHCAAEPGLRNGVAKNNPEAGGEPSEQERLVRKEDTGAVVCDVTEEANSLSATPIKKRSPVWQYYQDGTDASRALCLVCSENIHYRQNTSNLLRHLRKKHPSEYADIEGRTQRGGVEDAGADRPPTFKRPVPPSACRSSDRCSTDALEVAAEQSQQMRRTLEQETRALERERELTEQLRRAQQQEARALEQQRELTEQLRRAQEEEMRRVRELETRALQQERQAVEQLRKAQEQESRAIEREREALEQLRRELEEDRKALQRHWDLLAQNRVASIGEAEVKGQGEMGLGLEAGDVEMVVMTT